jgi:hypothetical protein
MGSAAFMLLAFAGKANAQAKVKDQLENKIFTVEVTEEKEGKDPGKPYADEITFKSQKFKAKFATDAGFAANVYECTVDSTAEGKPIEFSIETKNADTQERFSCEGTVKGDKIEGTAYYIKKGKTKLTYKFEGELKSKKPAPKKPTTAPKPADEKKDENKEEKKEE